MSCIFASSKYYKQATANALDISEPIGDAFLSSKMNRQFKPRKTGKLDMKQVYDKPHHRILSQRRTPFDQLQQYLKVSELPKKNEYITPSYFEFIRNQCPREFILAISHQFIPHFKPQYSMVELSQILSNPRIQSSTHIEDYALSKFLFVCEGCDTWRMRYLYEYFNRRIIEYGVQCVFVNHDNINKQDLLIQPNSINICEPPTDIEDVDAVRELIKCINYGNSNKDPLYGGVHFYFSDLTKKSVEKADYFQRQILHYPIIQYSITVMSGILGEGQTAVFRLCGAFKHKTFQLICLLKLIFNGKVALVKTLGSNPFLPDCYLVCEHFNKQNGEVVHQYLLDNYHLLKEYEGQKFLLDPKKLLKEELHSNVKQFNDNLFKKGLQPHIKQFKQNSNIQYYPPKAKILQRLPKYAIDLQNIINEMIKIQTKAPPQEMQDEKLQKDNFNNRNNNHKDSKDNNKQENEDAAKSKEIKEQPAKETSTKSKFSARGLFAKNKTPKNTSQGKDKN